LCNDGHAGEFCSESIQLYFIILNFKDYFLINLVACISSNCSGYGVCLFEKCKCFNGFSGAACDTEFFMMNKSLCTNNREFDYSLSICKCNKGWTDSDCPRNENCIDKFCKNCKSGWNGSNCEIKTIETCSSKCLLNGICVNNTCICSLDFHGRNCEINSP
jgi:hypothetical protein